MSCAPGRALSPHIAAHTPPARIVETSTLLRNPVSSRRAVIRVGVSAATIAALTTLAAGPALAAATAAGPTTINGVISNLQSWLIGILAALATLFLVIGGVRYVMSGGNPGEVEKAKTAFKSAALGYCLAILAPVVMTVLQGIVGS